MPRGKYVNHKGRHRHFSMPEEMEKQMNETEESSEEETGSESGEDNEVGGAGASKTRNTANAKAKKSPASKKSSGQKGRASDDSDEDDDDDDDDEDGVEGRDSGAKKGVAGLIQINNPNRQIRKLANKVEGVSLESKTELSGSDRKQLEKQRAQREYQKLHAEGKTFQAKADLARLALIRQQREEAAAKREAERKQQEESKKTTSSSVHVKPTATSTKSTTSKESKRNS